MSRRNEILEAAIDELRQNGITEYTVRVGRHVKLSFDVQPGKPGTVFLASTGSDHRAQKNARRDVRRVIRERKEK